MVKAGESWPCLQQYAWQRLNQNCMSSLLEHSQEEYLPACLNSSTRLLSANLTFPRSPVPDTPIPGMQQTIEARGLLHCVPPHFQTSPYGFPHGPPEKALPNVLPASSQKKLLVFDQCGAQTRLVYSSILAPTATANNASTKVACQYGMQGDEQIDQTKSILHIGSTENKYGYGDESEMHEDTEELNALLYSDDNTDEYSDEVRSTGHSPMLKHQIEEIEEKAWSLSFPSKRKMFDTVNVKSYEDHEQHEGITEEVSDSNGPNKRQKLVNLMDTGTSVKPVESNNSDTYSESSCAMRKTGRESILKTLRVLETIVPGTKGKKPLLILDSAIEYLKHLKSKGNTLLE